MKVIERYSAFAATMAPPPKALHAAKCCLLDWLGAAIAGSVHAPATHLRKVFPGEGAARLIADGETCDARTAALINGTASHIVEVDDIYRSSLYHPGVVTIPAALALGQAEDATGAEVLNAIIAGYEVSNRIARDVNPTHYRHWHTTGTVGHFGATIAAARILGLDSIQTAHAMATATTFAAGLRHAFSSDAMSKPLHAGRAAEAGVTAALMAREGVTGVLDILEGERGFAAAMSEDVDWEPSLASLGTEWTIIDTTPKAHACCGHNFAALDAIAILMKEHALQATDILRIDIASYRAAAEICGNPDPQTAAEARFSLPYCASVMAHRGAVTPNAFSEEALGDRKTRAFMQKVSVTISEDAEARFPDARSATVTLTLTDGRKIEHHRPTRKGDPDDPMSDDDLTSKFNARSNPIVGETQSSILS
ncbi:MAG: MmgE/PrpD family protein, partial [Pseudomonadota bacterium]